LKRLAASVAIACVILAHPSNAQTPTGEVKGHAWQHTDQSLAAAIGQGSLVLPQSLTGGDVFVGKFADAPPTHGIAPTVLFLHGSSGLGLRAIGEWQLWLASLGWASVAPDSFALPDRITYTSPVGKDVYEHIHALRASEIRAGLGALLKTTWADPHRLILAGASEGSVAVARYPGHEFAGRIVYSWSCEPNYFVTDPQNAFAPNEPVLNVMSVSDPYFSRSNTYLGNPNAKGNCAEALKDDSHAVIVLIPKAPHTLMNLPAAYDATAAFLAQFTSNRVR
jgi:dienelactone hydrolase